MATLTLKVPPLFSLVKNLFNFCATSFSVQTLAISDFFGKTGEDIDQLWSSPEAKKKYINPPMTSTDADTETKQ